jgi:hypothetical protein
LSTAGTFPKLQEKQQSSSSTTSATFESFASLRTSLIATPSSSFLASFGGRMDMPFKQDHFPFMTGKSRKHLLALRPLAFAFGSPCAD